MIAALSAAVKALEPVENLLRTIGDRPSANPTFPATTIWTMSAEEVEVAERFREALEAAARTGDREPVYALLAADVEWVTPRRTLHGIDEMRANWTWGSSPESFEYVFEEGNRTDRGDGRLVCDVRQVYQLKETGDFAYERNRRIQLTICDGKITQYEMSIVG